MVGLLFGQVEQRQAGQGLDALQRLGNALFGRAAEHEPHVPGVFASIVVRHFRQALQLLGDLFKAFFGHRQGGEGKGAAQAFDVEHRAEAREHAVSEQGMQSLEQFIAAALQFRSQYPPRVAHQRQAQLQAIDQATVEVIHGLVLLCARAQSGRRTA